MSEIALEIAVILVLLVANGVFAMAEIAVVSARKGRLKQLADSGDSRARMALDLAGSPNRFLATVQFNITLVGIIAGAFGGATIAEKITAAIKPMAMLAPYAEAIGIGVVVMAITYFSLIIGELVPKRLGLANPEGIAKLVAKPMQRLSVLAGPIVAFLSLSTDLFMRLLGVKPVQEATVSEEEVKMLVKEGLRAGVFLPTESAMVESVLALDRVPVRDLMTPRAKIIWINLHDPHDKIWHKVVVSGHTNFPVFDGNRDNVVGVLSVKSVYANLAAGTSANVKDLMTPPLVVPATQTTVQLLESFKKSGKHIALVTDEFGSTVGLVTLHDVMEAIIGELPSLDERLKPKAVRREDGSWLVDAMLDIDEFEQVVPNFKLPPSSERDYQTFAGFIVKHLGHVPVEGETFRLHGYDVEIIDMDRHRVDKALLMPVKPLENAPPEPRGG